MSYNHNFSSYTKLPDALEISLEDVISPVIKRKGSMVSNPEASVTWKAQSFGIDFPRGCSLPKNPSSKHSS